MSFGVTYIEEELSAADRLRLDLILPDQASLAFVDQGGRKCVLEHRCNQCVTQPEVEVS